MEEQPNLKRWPATTLNDLPESLLIHILTLLPISSAIKTSFISRQWRNLWHSMPILDFNSDDEPLFSNDGYQRREYDIRLANTITQVLVNRPKSNPLPVFRLNFIYGNNQRHRSFVTTWIRYALDCNVEDMTLFFDSDDEAIYRFHFFNIKNSRVRCLRLLNCEVVMPPVDSVQFDSLRYLSLSCIPMNDGLISDLISRCKNLEKLSLYYCFSGMKFFKICSKTLKVLKLFDTDTRKGDVNQESSVEIHTPNLSWIKLSGFYVANYAGNLSSVKLAQMSVWCSGDMHENFHKSWANAMNLLCDVETLKIKYMLPRYVHSKFESNGCFQLERLKHLKVKVAYTFADMLGVFLLLERAPALRTLVFFDDEPQRNNEKGNFDEFDDKFNNMPFKIRIPCLHEVKMIGFRNTKIEFWILLLIWKHGVVLNKVVLVPAIRGKPTVVLDPTSDDFKKFWAEKSPKIQEEED